MVVNCTKQVFPCLSLFFALYFISRKICKYSAFTFLSSKYRLRKGTEMCRCVVSVNVCFVVHFLYM